MSTTGGSAEFEAWTPPVLQAPCGPAEGAWSQRSMAELVLHINREVIHHGAEIALLRDLYAHREGTRDQITG